MINFFVHTLNFTSLLCGTISSKWIYIVLYLISTLLWHLYESYLLIYGNKVSSMIEIYRVIERNTRPDIGFSFHPKEKLILSNNLLWGHQILHSLRNALDQYDLPLNPTWRLKSRLPRLSLFESFKVGTFMRVEMNYSYSHGLEPTKL